MNLEFSLYFGILDLAWRRKKCKSGAEKQRWPNWCWTGRWIKWQFPFSPENGNCPDNRFFNQLFYWTISWGAFSAKKYASSFNYMYESREMAFLLALVLVVEEGKRQYSVGFELFVVLKKIYLGCVISWQPINRSIGHQIETQMSRFGLSSQSWNPWWLWRKSW